MRKETLLLLACIHTCYSFWTTPEFNGMLTPSEPKVCTTQDITFTCVLLDLPRPNFSIGFVVKNEREFSSYVLVDNARVTVVNKSMSRFTMYNISGTSIMKSYVRCYYWQEIGDLDETLHIGDTATAHIYPLPETVQDFKCVVSNYKSMNCSWDLGKEYGTRLPDVIFQWRLTAFPSAWNDCPSSNSVKESYCSWKNVEHGYFQLSNITIQLTLKQKCGENATSFFPIDTAKIVKPNPVVSLTAEPLNSTCILVSWRSTDSEPQHLKEHKVSVYSKGDDKTTVSYNTTTKKEEELPHNMTFCDLRPYTEYQFFVSIRPIGIYSGYFSEEKECAAKTYPDKPSTSPEVTEGGYSWQLRGNNQREVCVFWKQIKEEDENGVMRGLRGMFTHTNVPGHIIYGDWAEDTTYGCKTLMSNTSYIFNITARNEVGTSENASTLEISSVKSELLRPQFVVESANGSDVYVSWIYTGTLIARGFIVAWCRNRDGNCDNFIDVNWKRFPPDTSEAVIHIDSSIATQAFMYGVGVITYNGSSGMDWEECVYLKDTVPTIAPKNVIVSEASNDNTLIVTWDKLPCKSDEPYIQKYSVMYKADNHVYQSKDISALAEARLVLADLKEDQPYQVTVRGITREGRYGPESQPQIGIPVNRSLKPDAIVGITMAVLVCVIFASVGCFCIIRKCKNKAKKAIEEAGKITIPNSVGLELSSFERQDSYDSGYQMTPPPDKHSESIKSINTQFIRPDDYLFVTERNDTNEGIAEDISKLDPRMLSPFAGKPCVSRNLDEPVNMLSNSSGKFKCIQEIPKPLAFIMQLDTDMFSEENDIIESFKEKSVAHVTAQKVVSDNTSEISKYTEKGFPNIPSAPPENESDTDIKSNAKNTAKLLDKLEAKPISQAANVTTEKQSQVIAGRRSSLNTVRLLTQIPRPQELNSSMYSGSCGQNENKENGIKPLVILPPISSRAQPECINIQNSDYVTIPKACSQPSLSLQRSLITSDISYGTKITDVSPRESEVTQNPPLIVASDSLSSKEANRRFQESSIGYVTSVVDLTSKKTKSLTSLEIPVTQTPCRVSNKTISVQKNTLSQHNVTADSTFDQDVLLANSEEFMPQMPLGQINATTVQDKKHTSLPGGPLVNKECELYYLDFQSSDAKGNIPNSLENQIILGPSSHVQDNSGYIPVNAARALTPSSAFGNYVPNCAVEVNFEIHKAGKIDSPETVANNRNIETNGVFPPPDTNFCILANRRQQLDGEHLNGKPLRREISAGVSKSPESCFCPAPDTYVLLNQDDTKPQPVAVKGHDPFPGYVDETFAGIPLDKANYFLEETDTIASVKSQNDGYIDHSVMESLNGRLNLTRDRDSQFDCDITCPIVDDACETIEPLRKLINSDGYVCHLGLQGKITQNKEQKEVKTPNFSVSSQKATADLNDSSLMETQETYGNVECHMSSLSGNDIVNPYCCDKKLRPTCEITQIFTEDGKGEVQPKTESDSGLESPEQSPQMERKQNENDNGYISCDAALSMQQ